ncbi:MAG TPA: histidine kinase [Candidatus Dormibacteraeota bacterium]|nr:histidine kinase [Candidatus Dormibacteraeota bacterium]
MLGKLRPTTAAWLAWSLWVLALGLSVSTLVLLVTNRSWWNATAWFALSTTGAVIASRRSANPIGWLYCAMGFLGALTTFSQQYAIRGLVDHPGSLPGAVYFAWLERWSLWFVFPAGIALVLLLFPTGRPASARWRPLVWVSISCALLMVVGSMFSPGRMGDALRPPSGPGTDFGVQNPFGIGALGGALDLADIVGRMGAFVLILIAAVGLVIRLVRARGDERQQLKWVGYVGSFIAVGVLGSAFLGSGGPFGFTGNPALQDFSFAVLLAGFVVGLPVATAIAVLKYRLYDIDLVINKSLVYGALAIFITTVYVAIVVGIGRLVGTSGKPNLGLSILATALVAVAFQPVRERIQRVANRLVYGKRATPYEALSQFSDRLASTYSDEQVLPRLAQTIAESTGAVQAVIWAKEGAENTTLASWPAPNGSAMTAPSITERSSSDRMVPVQHQGELLGALSIRKARGEAVTPVDEKMLADLASPAGVVLRNLQLTRQLQARLAEISAQTTELQASSARIIAAQDSTRRRLERNIHDGAQQHLVAIAVKLRLAATLAKRDPARAARLLDELEGETHQALETLHALARGIYPPILRELGLESAVRAQGARFPLPIDVSATSLTRYPSEVEGAVYFCCLEALQNVVKHAKATRVRIRLEDRGGELAFSVDDDGGGFDPLRVRHGSGLQNIADRLAALGGHLTVIPGREGGTSVQGRVPIRNLEPVV